MTDLLNTWKEDGTARWVRVSNDANPYALKRWYVFVEKDFEEVRENLEA